MVLIDAVARLGELNLSHTIYAKKPWTPHSEVVVAAQPADESLVPEALKFQGYSYFLEVDIGVDFLSGWQSNLAAEPSLEQSCQRLIQYAVNDA